MNRTRRGFITSVAGLAAATGLAGCADTFADDAAGGDDAMEVQTSVFVLYDFARRVGGDAATVESIVPFGQHGHGWEPSAQVQRDVLESDAFVYMGEGFQPWADDVVENVRRDAPDVTIIDAREGIDLGAHEERHDDRGGADETEHDGGHAESDHDHPADDSADSDPTDDPHFWLNPKLAKQAVHTIEQGFAEADGDNADAYEENGHSFEADLDELDATFEKELADREKDVVLVAGHNAFGYLGERYDFEVYALTGVSPDAEPGPQAIARAQEFVGEHDIEHILTPALESDRAATQLVAETDAKETLPITALAGLTDEWRENDWGYLEVMENVNLSSLKTALQVR